MTHDHYYSTVGEGGGGGGTTFQKKISIISNSHTQAGRKSKMQADRQMYSQAKIQSISQNSSAKFSGISKKKQQENNHNQ